MKISFVRAVVIILCALLLLPLTPISSLGEIELGNYLFGGDVDLGGRFFIDRPARPNRGYFEIYRDFPTGFVLERMDLHLIDKDFSRYFEILVTEPGERDQNFLFRGGKIGQYEFEFEWDQLQHLYSTVFPTIDEVRVQWETARFAFTWTPRPEYDFSAEYKFTHKYGDIPRGAVTDFGVAPLTDSFGFVPFLEPVDYTEHFLTAGTEVAQEMYQFRLAYNLSLFDNETNFIRFPSSSDFLSLPASNMAQYITASGGINLPARTRLSGSFSYGWLSQDNFNLPDTASNVSAPSLNVNNIFGYASAISRPVESLTLKAYYRVYSYQDSLFSDEPASLLLSDTSHYTFTKQTASFDAKWALPIPGSIDIGYRYDQWDRDNNNGDTNEHTPKVALKFNPFNWLNLTASYAHSIRNGLNATESFDPALLDPAQTKFYTADRERDKVDFVTEIMPLDNLIFSINFGLANDSYNNSAFGLLDDKNWSVGADVAWSPIQRLSLSFGYMHEQYKTREDVLGGTIDLDPGTLLQTDDAFDTFTTGLNLVIIPQKMDLSSRYGYSFSRSVFNNTELPDLKETIHRFESFLRYRFTKNLAVKVGYVFENFDITDRYARYDITTSPVEYDLDGYYKPFTAHMMVGLVQYKF
jgi:MtrB/PioB family decaheme-associated outer membrane protein